MPSPLIDHAYSGAGAYGGIGGDGGRGGDGGGGDGGGDGGGGDGGGDGGGGDGGGEGDVWAETLPMMRKTRAIWRIMVISSSGRELARVGLVACTKLRRTTDAARGAERSSGALTGFLWQARAR